MHTTFSSLNKVNIPPKGPLWVWTTTFDTATWPFLKFDMRHIVGEPDPKFGKVQGRRGTEGLTTDSYVKIPDGSESWLRLWA